MPPTVSTPTILTDPGFLWIAPLGSAVPTVDEATGFSVLDAAWIPLGATIEGSTFSYSTTVEAIRVAELFDPVQYATTERSGSMTFSLADWTLTNVQRALNGGVAALAPAGAAAVATFEPPNPGEEVRAMLLWESTDSTVRIIIYQALQGGEVSMGFQKAPTVAGIPFTFNFEIPDGGKPFTMQTAGATRV